MFHFFINPATFLYLDLPTNHALYYPLQAVMPVDWLSNILVVGFTFVQTASVQKLCYFLGQLRKHNILKGRREVKLQDSFGKGDTKLIDNMGCSQITLCSTFKHL